MKEYRYWVRKSYRYLLMSLGWMVKKNKHNWTPKGRGKNILLIFMEHGRSQFILPII